MDIEEIYDQNIDKVYKFFYIKCLNRQVAEDLTSDTFMSYMKQVSKKRVDDNKKYLYGIMRLVWIEFLKQKYKMQVSSFEAIENFEEYASELIIDFEGIVEPTERLRPYVEQLPAKQKDVLIMRIYQNLSIKETASQLGKDSNYVKTTYSRAIRRLRELIAQPYIGKENKV